MADSRCDEAVVIGASGGMGQGLRRRFASMRIPVTGLDKAGGPGVGAEDVFSLSQASIERISSAGLVVIAVEDRLAIRAAAAVLPYIHPDSVLMDCTSVKTAYCQAVAGVSPCAKVSINPLFGPGLEWTNGTMAVTTITDGPAVEHWLRVFRRMGLTLQMIDPETHDRLSAEAQGIVHALLIAYALGVTNLNGSFSPPPCELLGLMAARMLSMEPHTYWSIQVANPFSRVARRRLGDALRHLDQICETQDEAAFEAIWKVQREKVGPLLAERAAKCKQIFESMMKTASHSSRLEARQATPPADIQSNES